MPVARQTRDVGGSDADGEREGRANAEDLIATFSEGYLVAQGGEFLVFLDVEGSGSSRLTTEYYTGWARGLASTSRAVSFRPCVYGLPRDAVTWTALARAIANGVDCQGLWLAHPLKNASEPVAWDPVLTTPSPDPGAPVLLWQYMFPRDGAQLDRSMVNPSIDADATLLRRLILPPSSS